MKDMRLREAQGAIIITRCVRTGNCRGRDSYAVWCSTTSSTSGTRASAEQASMASFWFAPARRTRRYLVAIRAGARSQQWFKGTILLSARSPTLEHRLRARTRRRPGVYRHALHRHRGSQRRSGLQARARAHAAHDIVYSNLFTGCMQLSRSVDRGGGLDPDNLPIADKSKMNFGSGGNMKVKAWRDIWVRDRVSARSQMHRRSRNWWNA